MMFFDKALPLDFLHDARIRVLGVLLVFLTLGMYFLGFDKSPSQIVFMILAAVLLDLVFHNLTQRESRNLVPISGMITGTGLSILTHYPQTIWLGVIPVFLAISSKYLVTHNNKHIFNPGLFGIVLTLLFWGGGISVAPAYQWGGIVSFCVLIVLIACSLFLFNIKRHVLTLCFLGAYFLQLFVRSYTIDHDIPFEMLLSGTLQSPAFYLFTFFMLTDPKTSPNSVWGQFGMAIWIVVADFIFHMFHFTFTLFYAGFSYFFVRFMWLHFYQSPWTFHIRLFGKWREATLFLAIMWLGTIVAERVVFFISMPSPQPTFYLQKLETEQTGLRGEKSDILQKTDPRIAHIAKWFYSIGDAVAIADVNQDGLPDVFLTQPLKSAEDRAQLYLNVGNFKFEKHDIPELDLLRENPETYGSPTQALWFDFDNDGDHDLFITVFFGHPYLLKNKLAERGVLAFEDVSEEAGFTDYFNSGTANIADFNRDGYMDVIIGGTLPLYVSKGDYISPQLFNIFKLPQAQTLDDRRPLNVMRRNPSNSKNASQNILYLGQPNGKFLKQDNAQWGFEDEERWTLDVGVGDLNNDGWDDIYFANTAGPDRLYINLKGNKFQQIAGQFKNDVGQDTYRGMNATLSDIDQNGYLDIYVSNVHKPELAEGSLLWMNDGSLLFNRAQALKNKAFEKNAYNPDRFSWGGAIVDIDMDGDVDILQTAGWLDDAYDGVQQPNNHTCSDYVYKLFQTEASPSHIHGYIDNWPDMRGACLYPRDPKRLLLNDNGHFIDVAEDVGWGTPENSRSIATADFDNDGDLDVIVTHMTGSPSLYKNVLDKRTKKWIGLEVQGDGKTCSADAVGTRVVLMEQSKEIENRIYGSNGLSAQHDTRMIFPTSAIEGKAKLRIYWCGSSVSRMYELEIGKYHHVKFFD